MLKSENRSAYVAKMEKRLHCSPRFINGTWEQKMYLKHVFSYVLFLKCRAWGI